MRRNPRKNRKSAARIENALLQTSKGYQKATFRIPGNIGKFTTVVTSGAIAQSVALDGATINNFATKWGVVFDEYRIIRWEFETYCMSSTNPGAIEMWVESLDSSTPNATASDTNTVLAFPASDISKCHKFAYTVNDPGLLVWKQCTTTNFISGYLKIYTDNANLASSIVATDYIVVRFTAVVEFRGLL